MTPALVLRGLTKDFAVGRRGVRLRAVDQLSLRVEAGEVYGLLGANGSGKSTALKLVLGLLTPTAGECSILGVSSRDAAARRAVGYLPESPGLYRYLTGRELVAFFGGLAGVRGAVLRARVDEVLGWAGLAAAADRRVGTYSQGMRQRLGLAQALVDRPRFLILDEPAAGVDAAGCAAQTALIRRLRAEGTAVLLTSHLSDQIAAVCDRVGVLEQGRLVREDSVATLAGEAEQLRLRGPELAPEDRAALERWLRVRGWTAEAAPGWPAGGAPAGFPGVFPGRN